MLDWAYNYPKSYLELNSKIEALQTYTIYEHPRYPTTLFLVLDSEGDNNVQSVTGLMFNKNTLEMLCGFSMKTPIEFKKVGYIYKPFEGFYLKLCKVEEK